MTLIIGVKCDDGIVVGADGAATLGSLGQHTAKQPVKKLDVIDKAIIVGVSGAVGLKQRLCETLSDAYKSKKLGSLTPVKVGSTLRAAFWSDFLQAELQAAAVAKGVVGNAAVSSAICSAVVALPVSREPVLIQFDPNGAPELATDDLPFVCIGSGQLIADPFLAFLRRIFWPNRVPTLSEGRLAVVWALQHAISTSPGGVADPMQLAVLERVGKDLTARICEKEELAEHCEVIAKTEVRVAKLLTENESDTEEAPDLPQAPEQQKVTSS